MEDHLNHKKRKTLKIQLIKIGILFKLDKILILLEIKPMADKHSNIHMFLIIDMILVDRHLYSKQEVNLYYPL